MDKAEIKKLIKRQEHLVTRLTNNRDEFLDMLEEFHSISVMLSKIEEGK